MSEVLSELRRSVEGSCAEALSEAVPKQGGTAPKRKRLRLSDVQVAIGVQLVRPPASAIGFHRFHPGPVTDAENGPENLDLDSEASHSHRLLAEQIQVVAISPLVTLESIQNLHKYC